MTPAEEAVIEAARAAVQPGDLVQLRLAVQRLEVERSWSLRFVVPGKPLGQNAAYRRRRGPGIGLMKTDEAKAFQAMIAACGVQARARVGAYLAPAFSEGVAVELRPYFADERPDLDGPVKLILDALQSPHGHSTGAGLYHNDRQVRRLLVVRERDARDPRVEITVTPLTAALRIR